MIYHVALDMACKELAEQSGGCPFEVHNVQIRDCGLECKIGIESDCWKRYFLKKIDDNRQ